MDTTNEILKIKGVVIYGNSKNKTGIISFNIDGIHPYDIGVIIDKLGVNLLFLMRPKISFLSLIFKKKKNKII